MKTPFLAGFLGFMAAACLTFPTRRFVARLGIFDRPNERSSHHVPIPRAGGLAIMAAISLAIVCCLKPTGELAMVVVCTATVAGVSLLDDVRPLPFWVRLVTQTVAAAAAVVGLRLAVRSVDLPGLELIVPFGVGLALAVLFVVAYANFFNFMDGINGLAAGQAVLSGMALSALLERAGCVQSAVAAAAVAGAAAGFLPHNFPSAQIFMGDVGSVTLGFSLAVLSLDATARGGVPWPSIILVHAVFLFDTVSTLAIRAARGESLVKPHRDHHFQLLIRRGWDHASVSLLLWSLTAWCGLAGYFYALLGLTARWNLLLITSVLLGGWSAVSRWGPTAGNAPHRGEVGRGVDGTHR